MMSMRSMFFMLVLYTLIGRFSIAPGVLKLIPVILFILHLILSGVSNERYILC